MPVGWRAMSLSEVAAGGFIRDGDWVESKDQDPAGDVRLTQLADVGVGVFRDRSNRWMRTDQVAAVRGTLLAFGDIMIARMPDPIGRACIYPDLPYDAVTAVDVTVLRIGRDEFDPQFVMWAINAPSFHGKVVEHQSGTTRKRIARKKLETLTVGIPPLKEQRRIVELLDDHLFSLDAASDGLELAARRADRLWLSAVTRLLFSSTERCMAPLIDLLDLSVGGVWGSAPGEDECDVRVLRVTEMSRNGSLDPSTAVLRSISKRQLDRRELRAGDLLLEKSGGGPNTPVGRVGLVGELDGSAICSNFMQLMRPNVDRVLPEYLHVYLQSLHLRGGTQTMQTASTNIRNIKASEYVRLSVPIPSMDEQARIVRELEELKASRQRLSSGLLAATRRGVGLRRALLDAAFSGRLTGRSSDLNRAEELAEANA
nr:restriction endonuclease subunit S [Modestobacter marinus]